MDIAELDFELPEDLIAQRPAEPRASARMLVVPRDGGARAHRTIADLPASLPPSLLVVNDTRVLPARLFGRREPGGGRVELLLLERRTPPGSVERWSALGRASKPLRPGTAIALDAQLRATVLGREEDGPELLVELSGPGEIDAALEAIGHMPLPPYVRRADDLEDRDRYQTMFAARPGAVAAPTAGLHFDATLCAALEAAGHAMAKITLHVGAGTFRPVTAARIDEHPMHEERFEVTEETVAAIEAARAVGRPIVAVGTTVVRALESAHVDGALRATAGRTRLLIQPGYVPRVVDGLLTNFHLPRSTLLALVMAFAGVDAIRAAYADAVRARYRFYSYGDAMLIPPAEARA